MKESLLDKIPPQSIEAETAVLGSMLISKESVPLVLHLLDENDFYKDANRYIFKTIKNLYIKNITPDVISVGEELKKDNLLDEVGGFQYLTSLINFTLTSANVEHYAKIVKDKSMLRKLITVSIKSIEDAYKGSEEIETILDRAQQSIFSLSFDEETRGLIKASELIEPTLERVEKMMVQKKDVPGLPTGFKKLDQILAGLHPNNFIIIAGRPSMGKTSFCINILSSVAIKEKMPVGFFSLEMSKEELMFRILCSEGRIESHLLRRGLLPKKYWPHITNVAMLLRDSPIYIDDTSDLSIIDLKLRSRKLSTELRTQGLQLSLIIIDYLQLLRGVGKYDNKQQEIAEISRLLKNLAKELKIPVVAVSQLSRRPEEREKERRRPQLSDLRESGALEQDADVVLFIYREGVYKPEDPSLRKKAEIIVAKQRHGPQGLVPLVFQDENARFEELAPEE